MKAARTYFNQRSLAFIVLISGILGGLLIVFSILFLCKYCLNRKNLREAEQMKLLYETLHQASLIDSNRFHNLNLRDISPLEPRRSNPIDQYSSIKYQSKKINSKQVPSDYHSSGDPSSHNQSYYEMREHTGSKQQNSHIDDEQLYLQVDPRCYVRQNSNVTLFPHRKSDTPRLEKGHSLNVDMRPSSPSSTSLSPYRQSSFDVPFTYSQQQQTSTPSPTTSTQQDIYYTPRGSNLSVMTNPISNTPPGSQHLSPPTPSTSRKNSNAMIIEKKDLVVTLDPFNSTSMVRSDVVQREHEYSRSLEHSSPPIEQDLSTNHTTNDKQSRSFDAVHLLRPGTNRPDVVNRRTKSYEYADDRRPSTASIAPPPIVIKIPDMTELVHAAQISQLQNRRESVDLDEYQRNTGRKNTLVQQLSSNDHKEENASTASQELWRLRQSYELEEQQRLEQNSIEELSPDLLTSTSIDSANALPVTTKSFTSATTTADDDLSRYQHRRKSSSNLLLPPPEVRRQALRRTFEKRRSCINESNARREQQQMNSLIDFNDENNQNSITEFSSLLNHFNSISENSSFERSLETDFDMQSDTSSRGPNDQFTSIESSGNENTIPDRRQSIQKIPSRQDDSGYKSLESQNSQNRTSSFDWMSADGGESVIYVGDNRLEQRSVDVKDLDEQLIDTQININNRRSPKLLHTGLHHSYQETSKNDTSMLSPNSQMMQQRSLSTNIPVVDYHDRPSPMNRSVLINTTIDKIIPASVSFIRTASKKRREFGKDKRHVSSNIDSLPINTNEQHPNIHQINETETKTSSLLQVRRSDLRRSKSDASKNSTLQNSDDSTRKESTSSSNQTKSDNCLLSSSNAILLSTPPPNPIRQHLSPHLIPTNNTRHILQRSPSATSNPQVVAFGSQRSSISFDHQTSLINNSSSTTANKNKFSSTAYSVLPTFITKPRLKFSMVRDSTSTNSGHNAPIYSMPITRDYSIDERTNRIVNEFLMHDPSLDDKTEENSHRSTTKRHHHHHHRIRQKTFDETSSINNTQKQSKSTGNKQRSHISSQTNIRRHSQHQYSSLHLPESIEQEEADSSDPTTSLITSNQPLTAAIRREITMATGSPSIIITGDDSGS